MREIKFRGKYLDDTSEWLYGNYVFIQDDIFQHKIADRNGLLLDIDINTLGQYTGLKDENGKEIYEGDIIEFSYDMFVGNFNTFVAKGKVVFEEGAFYVEVFENERTTEDEAYLLYSINLDTIEVIGNIYENKELLNETNR